MHTLLPAVLPLLETFLESFLWNLVQLGRRRLLLTQIWSLSAAFSVWGTAKNHKELCRESREPDESGECCVQPKNLESDAKNGRVHCRGGAAKFLLPKGPVLVVLYQFVQFFIVFKPPYLISFRRPKIFLLRLSSTKAGSFRITFSFNTHISDAQVTIGHNSGLPSFYIHLSSEGAVFVLRSFNTMAVVCRHQTDVRETQIVHVNPVLTVWRRNYCF